VKRWLIALAAFTALFYFSAWVCDDAFITFRTVDNFVRGHGLRWNLDERVQVFTSPLFALILSAPYALIADPGPGPNPDRIYWLVMAVSFVLSSAALVVLVGHRTLAEFAAILALLAGSQAFVSFTSSGLETPLIYLLIAIFYRQWLGGDPSSAGGYARRFLLASLILLTRLDLAILIFPPVAALVVSAWRRFRGRAVRALAIGGAPSALWLAFSLCYFGFLLPNSYYAKVGIDAEPGVLWWLGQYYLTRSLHQDPITLVLCGAGFLVGLTNGRTFAASAGIALYITYIASVGGDFLGFRFLASPFMVAVIVLVDRLSAWRWLIEPRWYLVPAAALIYSLAVPASPLRAFRDAPREPEAAFYHPASALSRWRPGVAFPFARFLEVESPSHCVALRAPTPTVAVWGDGLNGFCRGPLVHLIDPHGVTDPLLARLSIPVAGRFRPGHVFRPLPEGYVESLAEGRNLVADPSLAAFHGNLRTIVSGPLWTRERWRAIWRMNFTSDARFRHRYQAIEGYPEWMRQDAIRGRPR
jgi:arabinofuranosyltransferase